MGKSEQAMFQELKKSNEDLTKVVELLGRVITQPKRKSVNGIDFIPFQKSETPAPGAKPTFVELKADPVRLHAELKKMTDPSSPLQKSERDLITAFYCHNISVDGLAPLFQDKK